MRPRILKLDPQNVDHELIKQASEVIHNRGLVAFPTETVYGLGANALEPKAVSGIFEAKDRPLDDPLIVHISDKKDLYRLAREVPPEAEKLVERFWPGPLTIVLKKTDLVPDIVTTGLDTVAVRMPSNSIARTLIEIAGVPIAAPSANMFGRPSPTDAFHVVDDLKGKIDIVLDGGSTEIGVESTVVEIVVGKVIVLRPGGTSVEELRSLVGEVKIRTLEEEEKKSPGKYPQHYSPMAKVIVVEDLPSQIEDILAIAAENSSEGKKIGLLVKQENEGKYKKYNTKVLGPGEDGRTCASRLFNLFREFDKEGVSVIIAEGIPESGLGLAVMNRLRKAAGPDIVSCESSS